MSSSIYYEALLTEYLIKSTYFWPAKTVILFQAES